MLHHAAVPVTLRRALENLQPALAGSGFALAGGTSLALRFGHRISVDLDFFTGGVFDIVDLLGRLQVRPEQVTDRSSGSLQLLIDGVKVEFLRHAYPNLQPHETLEGITLFSLRDVGAMKLNAITNRGSKKDFFDLAVVLEHRPLAVLLDDFCQKYQVANRFMAIRSLAWFEDAEAEPDPVSLVEASWAAVKDRVTLAVAALA